MLLTGPSPITKDMGSTGEYPVHSVVTITDAVDIYRTDEWWKAAVRHTTGDAEDSAVAIYLWHHDGEDWTRKNKYNIKTADAWAMDQELINAYLSMDPSRASDPPEFPVSDYYHGAAGETVFQTDEWWKAIVLLDEKGSWETQEVVIYLWQAVEGDWRRRQKYAIKDESDWADDVAAVNNLLDGASALETTPGTTEVDVTAGVSPVQQIAAELGIEDIDDPEDLRAELERLHLSTSAAD